MLAPPERERGTSVVHPTSVSADPDPDAGALLRLGEVHAEAVARHALVADHTDGLLGAPAPPPPQSFSRPSLGMNRVHTHTNHSLDSQHTKSNM